MVLKLRLQVVIEIEIDYDRHVEGKRAKNVGYHDGNGQLKCLDLRFGQSLDRPVLSDGHVGHDRVEAVL